MVNGSKTSANGDELLISVSEPYRNAVELTGVEYSTIGETADTYFKKEFRWSTDGILYGDWKELNNDNLKAVLLDRNKPFYPQYKFTQVGNGELEFESIGLEITSIDGTITNIPLCGISDNANCCGEQNLVFSCCGNNFNPYAIGNGSAVYNQLCQVVSNMFGFCVQYFKTSADQRSKDVILHEYSLENVIAQGNIKIVVPDNQLPTREINFNPLMMDYPTIFEVHIVKSGFREAFGPNSRPEVHDYLYFETYMNKVYEINSVSETDDYMYTGAYWRVSLVQYQQRAAVKFETEELDLETQTLLFDSDKFNIEVEKQEKDVRKPEQYNTLGQGGNDYVRRILDKKLVIDNTPIYNNWTIISKSHYVLKSIPEGSVAVQYRYGKGWSTDDERQITAWFRPTTIGRDGPKHQVAKLENDNGYLHICVEDEFHAKPDDYIRLTHTNYDELLKVVYANEEERYVIVNAKFKDAEQDRGGIKTTVAKACANTFLKCGNGFSLTQEDGGLVVELNGVAHRFENGSQMFRRETWYGVVLAIKPIDKNIALWVYELGDGRKTVKRMDNKLTNTYYKCASIPSADFELANDYWTLLACEMDFANLRIWNSICEEDMHNLILSQYVVKDSHLFELVDNAQSELMLGKVTNPR